jgi:hypothetical protein
MLTLLGDRDRADQMGVAGAAWVRAELTWDQVAARLRALLREFEVTTAG